MPTRTSSIGMSTMSWTDERCRRAVEQDDTRTNGSVSVWPGYCTGVMIVKLVTMPRSGEVDLVGLARSASTSIGQ